MIDLTKPLQLRSGEPVAFLHRLEGQFLNDHVFVVTREGGHQGILMRPASGRYDHLVSPSDVINVPEPKKIVIRKGKVYGYFEGPRPPGWAWPNNGDGQLPQHASIRWDHVTYHKPVRDDAVLLAEVTREVYV